MFYRLLLKYNNKKTKKILKNITINNRLHVKKPKNDLINVYNLFL